jgi:predicted nucleic acid-binding protein
MTVVVDASVVVAALVDGGPDGEWAETVLRADGLAAPHLLPVEVASVLRRAIECGDISEDVAALAHADLQNLRVELFPYEPLASRVWALRKSVTPYDAWYVALAEALGAEVATLDRRLTRAHGPRCTFLTRPAHS